MKKLLLIAGLSILLLVAMAAPAMAQKLDVGVEVGDWFKYEAAVTEWVSDMEFLPPDFMGPLSLYENETNFILYTVTTITPGDAGDNVTFDITYDWINGSVTYGSLVENVSTANTNIFMIGANMTEGDMVSDAWLFFGFFDYPARYIDRTEDLENPNATRATNVLEYSIDIYGSVYDYAMWWDKITGMRVYYWNHGVVGVIGEQPAYTYTVEWKLVDSSVDGLLIPDLTGPILLLTIMSISIPIALLHRRKKIKI